MSVFERLPRTARALLDRVTVVAKTPRARRDLAGQQPAAGSSVPYVVYFADVPSSAYQLSQWLRPMETLDDAHGPVALLIRNPEMALALTAQTRLPVVFTDQMALVERFVEEHAVQVVFYVNNSQSNFTTLRINGPVHVHLSHGESEKSSMSSNQLKAYDYAFVAGDASVERILENVIGIDPSHLVPIGRPQLAVSDSSALTATVGSTQYTILYAPTWEGDSQQMAYGSLLSHGEDLVNKLLADPRVRLVFRPHPKSGSQSVPYRLAVARIRRLLQSPASRAAGHRTDQEADAVAIIARADVVVADVSAIAMDALGLNRPIVLCTRSGLDDGGMASHVAAWKDGNPEDAADQVVRLAGNPVPAAQATYRAHVFAAETPEEAVRLFVKESARAARRQAGRAIRDTS